MSKPGPAPKVSKDEIVKAVKDTRYPFATAGDVASAVSLSRERARQRLNKLVECEGLERETVGGSAVVYWFPESANTRP